MFHNVGTMIIVKVSNLKRKTSYTINGDCRDQRQDPLPPEL
jgi:hypothetical protein